ncbi:hypothetical protein B5807_10366 [Epicoccum nigrum]|uniref:Uncharacterized protein n=1 Tax=Epicoccum nigrum TaxID=105696 RepID=A0A1Y2LND4_EPING|nr:hypothetical protein B5807_10366 [Epicoccum nigrum]
MEGREVGGVTDAEMHYATRLRHSLVASASACFAPVGRTLHCQLQGPSQTNGLEEETRQNAHLAHYSGVQPPANTNTGCAASPMMSSMKREPAADADTRSPTQCISYRPMTQLKTRPSFSERLCKRHLY